MPTGFQKDAYEHITAAQPFPERLRHSSATHILCNIGQTLRLHEAILLKASYGLAFSRSETMEVRLRKQRLHRAVRIEKWAGGPETDFKQGGHQLEAGSNGGGGHEAS